MATKRHPRLRRSSRGKGKWEISERAILRIVRKKLPRMYTARVFKITSGDSGKIYYVQLIHRHHVKARIALCNCKYGYFRAPLTLGGYKKEHCKHIRFVRKWLRERKGTKHDKES